MYIPLYYTSFLFGLTSLLTTGSWMQPAFLWLMAFSILNHHNFANRKYNVYVNVIDRSIAHYIGARALYDAVSCQNKMCYSGVWAYYVCFIYTIWVYYVKKSYKLPSPYWQRWHATIHFSSCMGCYLLYRTPCVDKRFITV